jgi:hypothetical protein
MDMFPYSLSFTHFLGKMGRASRTGAGRSGLLNLSKHSFEEMRCDTNRVPCPHPSPPNHSGHGQLSGYSLCTASASLPEAHHTLVVLPRSSYPCSAASLAAPQCSASAVISIRQGCNNSRQTFRDTCTSPVCLQTLMSTTADAGGDAQKAVLQVCDNGGTY